MNSRRKGHSDEDSAKRVMFSIYSDGRTDLQITKRIQTGHFSSLCNSGNVAKVRALRVWKELNNNTSKWLDVSDCISTFMKS